MINGPLGEISSRLLAEKQTDGLKAMDFTLNTMDVILNNVEYFVQRMDDADNRIVEDGP